MTASLQFDDLDPKRDDYATRVVQRVLDSAVACGASDIHFDARAQGIDIRWRVAGNLLPLAQLPDGHSTSIMARIKALARLVTYRRDVPQEGRMTLGDSQLEARVGTLPTLHGERAVVRIIAKQTNAWLPEHLGMPTPTLASLRAALQFDSGVVLVAGTAGAGKTTTAYACLREIMRAQPCQRSVVTLEDPIESEIPGAAQSQINSSVGYDWSSGLKALLRQDPEVMLVGEIRDPPTAAVVFQAAMTGQLVITTMHARSSADALRRLLDMQVPVHHLRSALSLLLCQRLVRGACTSCNATARAVQSVESCQQPVRGDSSSCQEDGQESCEVCRGTRYAGRVLLAEQFPSLEGEIARVLLSDPNVATLQRAAQEAGMLSLEALAELAVAEGKIPVSEIDKYQR